MKRALSLILALALVLSLSVTAFAASGNIEDTFGSITIRTADPQAKFNIYRIFDLASFNDENPSDPGTGTYSYRLRQYCTHLTDPAAIALDKTTADFWREFAKLPTVKDVYIKISSDEFEYVSAVDSNLSFQPMAQLAAQYAKTNAVTPDHVVDFADPNVTKTQEVINGVTYYYATIDDLHLGYYFMDSTTGTMCSLTTNAPHVTVSDKNRPPVIDKKVQEDSSGSYRDEPNTADIGQVVNFQTTIYVRPGAENYIYHDKMDDCLDFDPSSVKVYQGTAVNEANLVDPANYTLISYVGENAAALPEGHDCTFEIVFRNEFVGAAEMVNQTLNVCYSATLNEKAVTGSGEEDNRNGGVLEYGDDHWTAWDYTHTNTYEFSVYKYTASAAATTTPLAGAKFILYRGTGENKEYAQFRDVQLNEDGTVSRDTYSYVTWVKDQSEATVMTTDETGYIAIRGLDVDSSYYLEEVEAPEGYNKLTAPINIIINLNGSVVYNDVITEDRVVPVANHAGTMLPSTGGTGTTLIYILGSILLLGAVVIFVTRRRVNAR